MTFYRRTKEESADIADKLLELDQYATTYRIDRGPPDDASPATPSLQQAEAP